MAAQEIHLEAVSSDASTLTSTAKQAPSSFVCYRNLEFAYSASPDGVDTNLLILLHGRGMPTHACNYLRLRALSGDNEQPFARLGKSLALPQTATLALKGPQIVPLLDEHEREWWAETDMLGMGKSLSPLDIFHQAKICSSSRIEVPNPDPGFSIKVLCDVLQELVAAPYNWSSESIHLFGFGQGGSLACEAGQAFYKRTGSPLGSIVSVHGPLLSLPSNTASKIPTPVLYVTRPIGSTKQQQPVSALERGYTRVQVAKLTGKPGEISMPRNKEEWQPIMEFWSEMLRQQNAWELGKTGEEVYEVKSGKDTVPIPQRTQSASVGADKVEMGPAKSALAADTKSGTSESVSAKTPSKPAAVSGMRRGFLSRGL